MIEGFEHGRRLASAKRARPLAAVLWLCGCALSLTGCQLFSAPGSRLAGIEAFEVQDPFISLKRDRDSDVVLYAAGGRTNEVDLRRGDWFLLAKPDGTREQYHLMVIDGNTAKLRRVQFEVTVSEAEETRRRESVVTVDSYKPDRPATQPVETTP